VYVLDLIRALPLALLPKRYWDSFDLPVANAATASAFIVLFLGFGLGIRGYFDYLERLRTTSKGVSIIEIAELQNQGKLPETANVSAVPTALAATAPIAFAFFTPLGALATYLVLASFFRIGASYAEDAHGDPILTGLDALARRWRGTHVQRSERAAREKLEGAEEPDRLYDGNWAGLPDVTYVVVAARRKAGWTKGTWVITNDGWYTLGEPFDRPMPHGMRTVYPLTLQTSTSDVLRKGVSYELPPLRLK
jgi:hypothetical protein